jgi:PAS domain S-box-containing protein
MKRRLLYGAATVVLILCVAFVVWQGSFRTEGLDPQGIAQVFLYWAASSLVFVLTVTLGFILVRTAVKLYIERQQGREGSRIKTKLVVGALALSFLPVVFLVLFSVQVLNFNLARWFTRPAETIKTEMVEVATSLRREVQAKADAQARWLAALDDVREIARDQASAPPELARLCESNGVAEAWLIRGDGARRQVCPPVFQLPERVIEGEAVVADADGLPASRLRVKVAAPVDLAEKEKALLEAVADFDNLARARKDVRQFYLMLIVLIGLFILFLASWLALFLAKQISVPIAALLEAAREVRSGNLSARVRVSAIDELATLVRAFNEMTQGLESNARELERRRRFTETILENIPTGVLTVASDGRILSGNTAFRKIFPSSSPPSSLDDIFMREDAAELRYLMKRARRTGTASRQFEILRDGRKVELAIMISSLDDSLTSGYVMVIEDSTELLQAQKAAAWQEVARRVAHEIKNPLTPISLSADRLARQLEKVQGPAETIRILRECAATIAQEVESVRNLVDEFSQFSRFPVAQPAWADLNSVVENALAVFEGRLDDVRVYRMLAPGLPPVFIDREQFKRVIVNLVDNAAEAMQEAPLKRLTVITQAPSPDMVELTISDTGRGISPEDREKLFLPYFSTKGRGTGLGLAIVRQILADHKAQIRVEDNRPTGARFVIEIRANGQAEQSPASEANLRAAVP